MQRYGTHIALLVLLVLLAAAIFDTVREDPTEHAMVGAGAVAFDLPPLGGGERAGPQDHRGQVVLLDFWATYCEPCREAMPALQRIHDDYAGADFELLSINVDPDRPGRDRGELIRRFQRSHRLDFPVLLDSGEASDAYQVVSIPYLVLIDRRGTVRFVHRQRVSESDLRAEIDELLGESS